MFAAKSKTVLATVTDWHMLLSMSVKYGDVECHLHGSYQFHSESTAGLSVDIDPDFSVNKEYHFPEESPEFCILSSSFNKVLDAHGNPTFKTNGNEIECSLTWKNPLDATIKEILKGD